MDRIKIPDHSSKTDLLDKAQQDRPAVAAALMVGALSLLGLQGSLVKLTSGEVSRWQTYQHITTHRQHITVDKRSKSS